MEPERKPWKNEPSFVSFSSINIENYRANLATNTLNSKAAYITCQLYQQAKNCDLIFQQKRAIKIEIKYM